MPMDIEKLNRSIDKSNTMAVQIISGQQALKVSIENLNNSIDELLKLQGGTPPQRACAPQAVVAGRPTYGSRRY